MSDALERVTLRGFDFDKMTLAALLAVEERVGFAIKITQGSYHPGTTASATTHDLGGAVDWIPPAGKWDAVVLAARRVGWAAWHRLPSQGDWPAHVHGILVGHPHLASLAAAQAAGYRDGRNGLGAFPFGPDDGPRLDPLPVFQYPPEDDMPTPQDLLNAQVAKDVSLKKAVREMHKDVAALKKAFKEFRDNELKRDRQRAKETEARTAKVLAAIDAIEVPEGMTKQEFKSITREVVQTQLGKLDSKPT